MAGLIEEQASRSEILCLYCYRHEKVQDSSYWPSGGLPPPRTRSSIIFDSSTNARVAPRTATSVSLVLVICLCYKGLYNSRLLDCFFPFLLDWPSFNRTGILKLALTASGRERSSRVRQIRGRQRVEAFGIGVIGLGLDCLFPFRLIVRTR